MYEMRRILAKQSTLAERFEHQGNISLLLVPNTAMHEFRPSVGC